MELSRDEEKALGGNNGEALATAYRILVAIGEATGAQKLVPTNGPTSLALTITP